MKKKICMILIAVFVAILGTSTFFIIDHYKESDKQAELYGELADLVNAAAQTDAATEPAEQIPYSEEKMLLPELAELYQQNGDLVGWISIADTNINYPVMQSVNEPNFYLKHGFDKEYSDYGCPYVQEDCDVQEPSDNLVIYGHHSYCIRTIGDLAKTDPDFLNRRLGKNGIALWQYANGNDRSRVMNADFVSPVKSVGHGITTIEDLENDEQVWPVFLELTQDIGHKLRVHKKCADGVAIHIRDNTLFSKQWQTALDMPTQSPMLIAKAAFALFEKRYDWRNPIRSVTIQAINLVPQDTPRQVDLFMNIEKIEKAERLDQCIETIRQRFGKNSIRNGILFQNLRMPSEKPEITMPTGVLC